MPRLINTMSLKHDDVAPTTGNVLSSRAAIIIGDVLTFGASGNTKHRTQCDKNLSHHDLCVGANATVAFLSRYFFAEENDDTSIVVSVVVHFNKQRVIVAMLRVVTLHSIVFFVVLIG